MYSLSLPSWKEGVLIHHKNISLWALRIILIILLAIGAVAFVTLLERKILGLTQIRLGPSKATVRGVLQPVADGVKLLKKQNLRNKSSQPLIFLLRPALLIRIFILIWGWFLPWLGHLFNIKHSLLLFFSLLGVRAYIIIFTGWRSTSAFSKLGRIRGMLQSLSYEVALILLFVCLLISANRFNLLALLRSSEVVFLWVALWVILVLIETNRAPFDLLEGERELIRGFNIEIGRLIFVYLFLREYGILIIIALITNFIIEGCNTFIRIVITRIFLLFRSCFPRFKYDSLITLIWQIILPIRGIMAYWRLYYRKSEGTLDYESSDFLQSPSL